jgi:hypothetical protein
MRSRFRVRRWLLGVAAFVAAGLVFTAAGLVVNAWLGPGQQPQAFPPTAFPVPPWDTPPPPTPAAPSSPSAASPLLPSPVRVIPGTEEADGVPLGYPRTLLGAVSAAVAFTPAILGTLDPGRAAQVMRMVADPSFPQGPAQAAEGMTRIRQSLGLAASGPVPLGVSWAVTPVECQARDIGTDRVTVLLLLDLISVVPGAETITRVSVFAVAVHWTAGDWKVLPTPATGYAKLTAAPGSKQAASLGWLQLTGEQP